MSKWLHGSIGFYIFKNSNWFEELFCDLKTGFGGAICTTSIGVLILSTLMTTRIGVLKESLFTTPKSIGGVCYDLKKVKFSLF